MAKKKPMFGVNNYHKRTPKKRPGQHAKSYSKRKPYRKKYRGQGRWFSILNCYDCLSQSKMRNKLSIEV